MSENRFYLVENNYVGPNTQQHSDDGEEMYIQTQPGKTNMSNEPKTDGWLGTTNDWSQTAHGEFETIEEARTAAAALGYVREQTTEDLHDENLVEVYRRGEYQQMNREETIEWCYEGLRQDISREISAADLAQEYEDAANADGYTLDTDALETHITERRAQ